MAEKETIKEMGRVKAKARGKINRPQGRNQHGSKIIVGQIFLSEEKI